MVRLTSITTKTGDNGTTSIAGGVRLPKDDLRIHAIGAVDEANCAIGVAASLMEPENSMRTLLFHIQNDLFDLGADLAVQTSPAEITGESSLQRLRITPQQVAWLERHITSYNADLTPLTSFVLPGGTLLAGHLHVARATVRRAEREVVSLSVRDAINLHLAVYLNRLSDLMFILARTANDQGRRDILWVSGKFLDGREV